MRVLITGGAGYLGSQLTRILLHGGHQVRVLDSLMYGGESMLGLWHDAGFEFVHGDVRSTQALNDALEGIDTVVHLAAIVGDPACARQPDLTRHVNLDSALRAYQLSRERGAQRFIFASTCSNYGKMPDPSQYLTEESELRPVSLYAETKVAVERALLDTQDNGALGVTVLRFATLFGLSPRMRFDLTVNEFTKELLTKGRLQVYGEQFWRPYIHVVDAARAIALALSASRPEVAGKVFNVGDSSQNYQKGQLAELIRGQVGGGAEIDYVHGKEDPRDYRVSFDKLTQTLGFQISTTVEDGVREMIDAINKGIITDLDHPRYGN